LQFPAAHPCAKENACHKDNKPKRPAARKNYVMVGLSLQQATHKLCIGRKAALGLRHMPGLMPPSPSRANVRAGGVMSAIRARHNL